MANTTFMMGGALGLAVLASLADARTRGLTVVGVDRLAALTLWSTEVSEALWVD